MQRIEWLNEREFTVGGARFRCALEDMSLKTDAERIIILKDRPSLDSYDQVFSAARPKTALEFGIFQGGSPLLFSLWFDVEKFVCLDISTPIEGFEEYRRTHPVGDRIKPYYGVDQSDAARVVSIIRQEFSDRPIDLIIDDASHFYALSRRTFEIAFPHLRPGGVYVVEDWGWAHWQGHSYGMGQSALSLLIFELAMVCASRPDLISEVRIFPSFVFVRKSTQATNMSEVPLDSLFRKRGMELLGAEAASLRWWTKNYWHRLKLAARQKLLGR